MVLKKWTGGLQMRMWTDKTRSLQQKFVSLCTQK
jgi:hypothetical protein